MDQQQLNRLMLGDYADREKPAIYPEKFWTEFKEGANPVTDTPVEMVKYVKRGAPGSAVTIPVEKIKKNGLYWSVLQPWYEAWKKGDETPENGMPLSAWPGCSPADKERFNFLRIYTVQDVAAMTDADCDRYGLGARAKRDMAKAFLAAGQQQEAAREIETLRQRVSQLETDYADALEAVRAMKARLPVEARAELDETMQNPVKRGPGRPKKEAA
jgi:hypothetical protein